MVVGWMTEFIPYWPTLSPFYIPPLPKSPRFHHCLPLSPRLSSLPAWNALKLLSPWLFLRPSSRLNPPKGPLSSQQSWGPLSSPRSMVFTGYCLGVLRFMHVLVWKFLEGLVPLHVSPLGFGTVVDACILKNSFLNKWMPLCLSTVLLAKL